jgi:GH15 family glucan-1,4-alpha-glucosidase
MIRGTSAFTELVEASRTIPQLLSPETRQQLQMARNGVRRLTQPSLSDWRYNWSHVSSLFLWLSEGELEVLQQFNPTVGFVSTPSDGIGAGFTETGRLCSLSFPHTGFTHQVPFYISGDAPEQRGKRWEGGFGGIETGGTRTWFWDDGVEHDIEYREHGGILDITTVCDDFHITESAYVYPESETLVRDFTIQNTSSERQEVTFIYHTRANVNDNDQTFALWNSNWNRLDGGNDLRWNDVQGPYELRIWCDAEDCRTETDGAITLGNAAFGKYLDGRLLVDFSVPAGDTREISVFTTGGADSTRATAIESDRGERQAAVGSWWDEWVADLAGDIPDEFTDLYIRSAITLGMLVDPRSGSLSASPNLQPMYYPSWVRDNAFGAIALAKMGKPELATPLLADFSPSIQEDDGSFKQCYNSRGDFTGIIPVENDQQPLFVWSVWEVYRETGDEQFLNSAWPAVKQALDYTIDVIDENGLLAPTPDIAEFPGDIRQSLWTNAFAYRGLLDGAKMAEQQGEDGEPYRRAATTIGDAIEREMFDIDIDPEWDPDGLPRIRMNGGQIVLHDACAIHPTEWASEYDREDRLFAELSQRIESEWSDWIPGSLLTAAMLYSRGEREQGDELVEEMRHETTETGYLAETRTQDGTHYFASPLAWSHAAFIYALSEMYINDQEKRMADNINQL